MPTKKYCSGTIFFDGLLKYRCGESLRAIDVSKNIPDHCPSCEREVEIDFDTSFYTAIRSAVMARNWAQEFRELEAKLKNADETIDRLREENKRQVDIFMRAMDSYKALAEMGKANADAHELSTQLALSRNELDSLKDGLLGFAEWGRSAKNLAMFAMEHGQNLQNHKEFEELFQTVMDAKWPEQKD